MSKWTERPLPYDRPDPLAVRTPNQIRRFISSRIKTGMDASLFFELDDEYRRLRVLEAQAKRREERENQITEADLRGHAGRPRKITK